MSHLVPSLSGTAINHMPTLDSSIPGANKWKLKIVLKAHWNSVCNQLHNPSILFEFI